MFRLMLCVLALGSIARLFAQPPPEPPYLQHEIGLGFGFGSSFESTIFNLPSNDAQGSPSLVFSLIYCYNLDERLALGFQLFGFVQTIKNVGVTDASNNFKIVDFDLEPYNLGVQGRYLLATGNLQPYIFGMLNLVGGSLENKEFGTLSLLGFSAGAGAGLRMFVHETVTIFLQGTGSFGSASFKEKPFLNSTGKEFNPSMLGLTLNAAYHWGIP